MQVWHRGLISCKLFPFFFQIIIWLKNELDYIFVVLFLYFLIELQILIISTIINYYCHVRINELWNNHLVTNINESQVCIIIIYMWLFRIIIWILVQNWTKNFWWKFYIFRMVHFRRFEWLFFVKCTNKRTCFLFYYKFSSFRCILISLIQVINFNRLWSSAQKKFHIFSSFISILLFQANINIL